MNALNLEFLSVIHAVVGVAVVCSGATAMFIKKGSNTHRCAGKTFVLSILLMTLVVVAEKITNSERISSLGLTFAFFMLYLVVSAWSTIHRPRNQVAWLDYLSPVFALCISVTCLVLGQDALNTQAVRSSAAPVEAYFFFASLSFVAMLLDLNNLKLGGLQGHHRIVRHVWRMTTVLIFSISTMFTGPGAIIFPETIRGSFVLELPAMLVTILAIIWLFGLLTSKHWARPR